MHLCTKVIEQTTIKGKQYDVIQVNGQDGGGKDFDDEYITGSTKKRIK
jgi:hypothetical protein